MSRFLFTLFFSLIAMSGLGMVIYGVLMKPSGEENEGTVLGFSDSGAEGANILDDLGHEGMKHREKEAYDPDRHRPDSI